MTRQSCKGMIYQPQHGAIVALEENPRAKQLQAGAETRRRSFAKRIGLYLRIQSGASRIHTWQVQRGGGYGSSDSQPNPNWLVVQP